MQVLQDLGPEWDRWLPPNMLPPKHNLVIEEPIASMLCLLLDCLRIAKMEIGFVCVVYLPYPVLNMFNFHSHRVGAVFLPHINAAHIALLNGPMGSKLVYRLKINTPRINTLRLSPTKASSIVAVAETHPDWLA